VFYLETNFHETNELLTADEIAKQLKVRKNTIYVWVARREIPFVKLPGNTTRFPRKVVEAWLAKRASKGKSLSRGIYLEDSPPQQAS
jgi:excisionase family DNA binding protein